MPIGRFIRRQAGFIARSAAILRFPEKKFPFFPLFGKFSTLKSKKLKNFSIFFKKKLAFGEIWGKIGVKRGN